MSLHPRLPAALLVLALSGCSVLPPHATLPQYHDFGPSAGVLPVRASVSVREVSAPAWIDNGDIQYRFLASAPTRLHAYATQRWIAPPSRLLAQWLRERLAPIDAPRYELSVELNRFEQDFDAAGSARAAIEVRVRISAADGTFVAARDFQDTVPTTPDVTGAVAGLAMLARHTSQNIADWAAAATRSAQP